ncbi:MAG: coenzyme F420-0:L-glutamate ligase [Firmicutes bacterium]|nr:coenzyme F420-0:L-glutamate ligase [Bacillota bacterium]
MGKEIRILGLGQFPEVSVGDDLASLIVDAVAREGIYLQDRDVVVIASKIVSKAEGRVIPRDSVKLGMVARRIGRVTRKDPREVQVILDSCQGIVGVIPLGLALKYLGVTPFWGDPERVKRAIEKESTLLMTLMLGGGLATDAGIDCSNVPEGFCPLPPNPDASARRIREDLRHLTGKEVAVILTDTEFRILRQGTTDIAIGVAGMDPIRRQFGNLDRFGRPKVGGMDAIADLIAGACALVMGQTAEGVPVVIVRGVDYAADTNKATNLAMPARWLQAGMLYFFWSRFRLWLARYTGI